MIRRRRLVLLAAGLCTLLLNGSVFHSWSRTSNSEDSVISDHPWARPVAVGHRIRTVGCTVPQFDPLDPSVKPYVHRQLKSGTICQGKPDFLSIRYITHLNPCIF
ncbi:hypothetical protein MRX96_010291 [Rhipicephalus microplus]|uniref:Secreted protein n=1 Tax=Rhipicephalus microplus TaxID=6941 RepID=A0A9J6DKB7_RHIMP|nr:hypothetical protein HPB51_023616 [Rhipicephalus microplus]